MKFTDQITLDLSSGHGGPGCVSFASDPIKPRGGPDGGDGGRGGNVVLRVNNRLSSLNHLRGFRQMKAQNGQPGRGQNCSGSHGEDLVLELPAGTLIRDESGQVLLDLVEGESVLLQGGRGGKGNSFFKTSITQAPVYAQPGEPGQDLRATLQLKLIADIGVIGFPNAGKSTLVSMLTSARPKIADYPFTTLNPQLGVVQLDESTNFTIADIPGLIEGASRGVGLGHQFLQHIERTKAFVHLLDVSDFSGRDPWEDFQIINRELEQYDAKFSDLPDFVPLIDRTQLVVFNKVDATSSDRLQDLDDIFRAHGISVIHLSAVTQKNKGELIRAMSHILYGDKNE